MLSATFASESVSVGFAISPFRKTKSFTSTVLKPVSSTRMTYDAGGRFGMVNRPSASVVATR